MRNQAGAGGFTARIWSCSEPGEPSYTKTIEVFDIIEEETSSEQSGEEQGSPRWKSVKQLTAKAVEAKDVSR